MTENRLHIGNLGPGDIALLKTVAAEAAEATTRKWFTMMGLNPDDPIASQTAFAQLREMTGRAADRETTADHVWVRRTRLRFEGAFGKVVLTAIAVSVVGAAHAAWAGISAILGAPRLH